MGPSRDWWQQFRDHVAENATMIIFGILVGYILGLIYL